MEPSVALLAFCSSSYLLSRRCSKEDSDALLAPSGPIGKPRDNTPSPYPVNESLASWSILYEPGNGLPPLALQNDRRLRIDKIRAILPSKGSERRTKPFELCQNRDTTRTESTDWSPTRRRTSSKWVTAT